MRESSFLWLEAGENADGSAAAAAYEAGIRTFEDSPVVRQALAGFPRESYSLYRVIPAEAELPDRTNDTDILLPEISEADLFRDGQAGRRLRQLAALRQEQPGMRTGIVFYGKAESLDTLMEEYGAGLCYCAFPLNYMDWTLSNAVRKAETAKRHGLAVIALAPTKHGILEKLPPDCDNEFRNLRPDSNSHEWCFSWLKTDSRASGTIIEGTDAESVRQALQALERSSPLNETEDCAAMYTSGRVRHIEDVAPCTGCGHCDGICPAGLDIPGLIGLVTNLQVDPDPKQIGAYRRLPEKKKASACVCCCRCVTVCPKNIPVPLILAELSEITEETTFNQ